MCKKNALSAPPLTMVTGNLVNLDKTAEMSPIKDNSKENFDNFGKKLKKFSN